MTSKLADRVYGFQADCDAGARDSDTRRAGAQEMGMQVWIANIHLGSKMNQTPDSGKGQNR